MGVAGRDEGANSSSADSKTNAMSCGEIGEKGCTEKREREREREREETAGRGADRQAGFYSVFIRGRVKAICIFNSRGRRHFVDT